MRSLMSDHPIDAVSTDRHTVKLWFAGHADVSPVVADFDDQGYRLIGGRADYFEPQRAAVVIFERGSHVINVFCRAADQCGLPKNTTRNGYHLGFRRAGNLLTAAALAAAVRWSRRRPADSPIPLTTLLYTAGFADQTDGVFGSIATTSTATSNPTPVGY